MRAPSCENIGLMFPIMATLEMCGGEQLSLLMCSAEDSPARTSATQASAPASTASAADCGPSTPELLASYDPATSSWKTSAPSCQAATNTNSQLTAAYVAGLIDGEGCLWVRASKGRWFSPRCDIGMSAKGLPVLRMMKEQFGGALCQQREATEKWEAAWRWTLEGDRLRTLLTEVAPHLVLKAEQARLLMALCTTNGQATKDRVSELNRKGPMTPESVLAAEGRWQTNQRDLLSGHGLAEFSETWPRSGLMRNGIAYRLPPLVPLTAATESGSWPTPDAMVANDGEDLDNWMARRARVKAQKKNGNGFGMPLAIAARMWPTPVARDYKGQGMSRTRRETRPPDNLCSAVLVTNGSGALNPTWVEWLMGYPSEWTALDASGIASSPKSSKSSGAQS